MLTNQETKGQSDSEVPRCFFPHGGRWNIWHKDSISKLMCNILSPLSSHTLVVAHFFALPLTFWVPGISHCCQVETKIGWNWTEACVGCSWKSWEWTAECKKLKNPMFGTPASLNVLIAGLKPPNKIHLHKCFQNASALARYLFPGHLFPCPSSDSLHAFRIGHSFPDLSYHHPSDNTKRPNCAASILHLLECHTSRGTSSPPRKALRLQCQLTQGFTQGVISGSRGTQAVWSCK